MLRNKLIPESELEEAQSGVAARLNGDIPKHDDCINAITQVLKKCAFEERKIDEFAWGTRNAGTVDVETNYLIWYYGDPKMTLYQPRRAAAMSCALIAGEPVAGRLSVTNSYSENFLDDINY